MSISSTTPSGITRKLDPYISDHYTTGGLYILNIKDSGLGIRQEELATIFDRFKKTNPGIGEGYGLGLPIVKSIISFHGFDIKVQSNFGEETVFSIIVPSEMVRLV